VITQKPLSHQAADMIREMIRKAELKKGQKIIEKELCESMNLSRTPIREALRLLHAEGLVKIAARRGAYVAQPCIDEIREMFDVIALLEGACAALAAANMSGEDLAALGRLHEELEMYAEKRDVEGYMRANNSIHTFVQENSGNSFLAGIVGGFRDRAFHYRVMSIDSAERMEQSLKAHRLLLEAFQTRNAKKAEIIMRKHLMAAFAKVSQLQAEG
jgi:DNA-binding GntR family transcriptional regulator